MDGQSVAERREELTVAEFERAIQLGVEIIKKFEELAPLISRMSSVRREEWRQAVNVRAGVMLCSKARMQRLVAYAQGEMPKHLALQDGGMSPRQYASLPGEAKAQLSDPEATFEIVKPREGVKRKRAQDMHSEELSQVFDPADGIRTPEQQRAMFGVPRHRPPPAQPSPPKPDDSEVDAAEGAFVRDGKLVLRGKSISLAMPVEEVRRLVAPSKEGEGA
jgi:hypothetical protein